jgi:ankyrin repeat protein
MYHHDIQHYCAGRPPLHYAIEFGVDFITKKLLPAKKDVDSLYHGMSALHEAAKRGDIATCITLLDYGASLELKSDPKYKSMTALHFAAEGGHSAVIKLLIAQGAALEAQSSSQSTPLFRAARSGSLEAVEVLYSAGSDINASTWDNWTPLFQALTHGFVDIAARLLAWGADPTITILAGQNSLMIIAGVRIKTYPKQGLHWSVGLDARTEALLNSTHQKIQLLQAQAQAQASTARTSNLFNELLANITPGYWRLEKIESDLRPGIERDRSRLSGEEVGIIDINSEKGYSSNF